MHIEFRAPANFDSIRDLSDDEEFFKTFIKDESQVFVNGQKMSKKERKKVLRHANVEIKLGKDEEGYYSSDLELPRYHQHDTHYCPTCSGNHRAEHC